MMEFELESWGDSTTRLVYWDYLHGDDEIFVLHPDGTVTEGGQAGLQVNLCLRLRAILEKQVQAAAIARARGEGDA